MVACRWQVTRFIFVTDRYKVRKYFQRSPSPSPPAVRTTGQQVTTGSGVLHSGGRREEEGEGEGGAPARSTSYKSARTREPSRSSLCLYRDKTPSGSAFLCLSAKEGGEGGRLSSHGADKARKLELPPSWMEVLFVCAPNVLLP